MKTAAAAVLLSLLSAPGSAREDVSLSSVNNEAAAIVAAAKAAAPKAPSGSQDLVKVAEQRLVLGLLWGTRMVQLALPGTTDFDGTLSFSSNALLWVRSRLRADFVRRSEPPAGFNHCAIDENQWLHSGEVCGFWSTPTAFVSASWNYEEDNEGHDSMVLYLTYYRLGAAK